MQVEAISIPAAAAAAFTATRAPSPAPSSFSVTLASSMSSSVPEHSGNQSAVDETTAKSDSKFGAKLDEKTGTGLVSKPDTNIESKPTPNTVPDRGASFNPSLNSPHPNSKCAGKSDAKAATIPGTTPSLSTPLPDTAPPSLTTLLTATALLSASLTTSPTTSNTAGAPLLAVFEERRFSTPAPNLADPSWNQQPVAQRLTANLARGTATPPPMILPPVAVPPGPTATFTKTTTDPPAATGSAGALPTSNSSKALGVLTANFSAANAPANFPVPTAASLKSPELPSAFGQAATGAAPAFQNIPAQPATAPAQFPTDSAPVLPTPTVLVSLAPISPASVIMTPSPARSSTAPVSISNAIAASPTLAPVDSQFHTPIPTGATIFALDPSPIVQSPSVPAAPLTPAPLTPATLSMKAEPPSLSSRSSDQPATSSAYDPSPAPLLDPAFNISPSTSFVPMPAPAPTPIPTLQSSVSGTDSAPLTELPNANQPAAPPSSDSMPGDLTRGSSTTAEPSPTSGSATTDTAPTQDLSSDATMAAAQTAGPPEVGFAVANNRNNNEPPLAPNLTPNSKPPAPTPPPIAATTKDAISNGKPGVSAPPTPAAPPQTNTTAAAQTARAPETGFAIRDTVADAVPDTVSDNNANNNANNNAPPSTPKLMPNPSAPAAIATTTNDAPSNNKLGVSPQPVSAAAPLTTATDKKPSAALEPNAAPSTAASLHDVPAAVNPGSDPSVTLTDPAPPAATASPQAGADPAPALPQAHQMLDSAPPAPATLPAAPIATDPTAAAQMHVGMRTDTFGAVEIHTVVQQSQIGITVHSDRDIAHWFSSEVPGLESGLNKSHLNLTAVDFDHGRSGVQTATSFQHGQPRQSFSQTPGSPSAAPPLALPEKDTAPEFAAVDILPSDLSAGPAPTHVSIHV